MKTFKQIFIVLLSLLTFIQHSPAAIAEGYVIVVNAANSSNADTDEIKNLFLKKRTIWSDGITAEPMARGHGSAEQEAFLKYVLGMTQTELDSYWASEKSKTGTTAPREVRSKNILLRQISRKDGSFGVLRKEDATSLPDSVKILMDF